MLNIGIDIGGTTIKGIIANNDKIIKIIKNPTNSKLGLDGILESLYLTIETLLPLVEKNSAIGISSAGDIDPYLGKVIYATDNLPNWTGLEIKKLLQNKYNRNVEVINDATSALIAELKYGSGTNCNNVVMITLGTGVGGGVFVNGKLLLGANCRGGRLGHTSLYPDGRVCNCGKLGCAEQYISATGLKITANNLGLNIDDINDIFSLEDKAKSKAIKDVFVKDLAVYIANLIAIFDPEVVIIGGGVAMTNEFWLDDLTKSINTKTKIMIAKMGNSAGALGATIIANDIRSLI